LKRKLEKKGLGSNVQLRPDTKRPEKIDKLNPKRGGKARLWGSRVCGSTSFNFTGPPTEKTVYAVFNKTRKLGRGRQKTEKGCTPRGNRNGDSNPTPTQND